jgi:hypothetical protein
MSDRWIQLDHTRLQVDARLGWVRWLIAVPCFFFGGYFFVRFFVLGVVEYIQAGDWGGLFGNPLGWLVILLMSAAFLVPGWIFATLRRRVVLDTAARTLTDTKDFLVYRRSRTISLAAVKAVVLVAEPVRKTSRHHYTVRLVSAAKESLPVGVMDDETAGEALGLAVAAMLGLTLETMSASAWAKAEYR